MMRTGIVILARWGASRKPGKMLAEIEGLPLLKHLIDRLKRVQRSPKMILATTCLPEDDQLAKVAKENDVLIYRGSVHDVVERSLGACQTYELDFSVVAEGDELFCDPTHIDQAIELALRTGADFVRTRNLPIGSWVTVVRRGALETVYCNKGNAITDGWSRFFTAPSLFHVEWFDPDPPIQPFDPKLRLTIDYDEDLILARKLYSRLYHSGEIVSLNDVLTLVRQESELIQINSFLNEVYWARLHSQVTQTESE